MVRGFLPSFSLFFSPSPIPSTPRSPSASFSNSFLFFERHYTSVLTFSRCRVRTGIDLCPPQMKTRGGPFSPFEWVILYGEVPCSIVVIPRFCQYYIELFIFRTLKRGWRESWRVRFSTGFAAICYFMYRDLWIYTPHSACVCQDYDNDVSRNVFDSIFYSTFE